MDAIRGASNFQVQDHCQPKSTQSSPAFTANQANGRPNFGAVQQQAAGGLQGAQQLGQQFNGIVQSGNSNGPTVAVIDDFGSSHGNEVAGIVQSGGASTLRFDVNNGGSRDQGVLNALDSVIGAVQSGQRVDAVNLSQQNFQANGATAAIQQRIGLLESMGVPVVVAAGNGGGGQANQYAGGASFVVEGDGPNSGRGNVHGQGATTSQAAAQVAAQVAIAHSQGL